MKVGVICSRNPICVRRNVAVLDAARRMRAEHVGSLVVVDDDGQGMVPVGMLTDRDVVVGVLAQNEDHFGLLDVGDVIAQGVVVAREDEDLGCVLRRMHAASVRRVPVVSSGGRLVGVLSLDDVLPALAHELSELALLVQQQSRAEAERRD